MNNWVRPWAVFTTVKEALDWVAKEGKARGLNLEIRAPRNGRSTFTVVDADEERAARELHEAQMDELRGSLQSIPQPRVDGKATPNRASPPARKGNVVAIRAVVETIEALREDRPMLELGPSSGEAGDPEDDDAAA